MHPTRSTVWHFFLNIWFLHNNTVVSYIKCDFAYFGEAVFAPRACCQSSLLRNNKFRSLFDRIVNLLCPNRDPYSAMPVNKNNALFLLHKRLIYYITMWRILFCPLFFFFWVRNLRFCVYNKALWATIRISHVVRLLMFLLNVLNCIWKGSSRKFLANDYFKLSNFINS